MARDLFWDALEQTRPVGRTVSEQTGNLRTLGGGRLPSTLRGRVRVIRKCLDGLAICTQKPFPRELTDYIQ